MKSKITIRSDRDIGPHIRIDAQQTEDVRDELIQQFIEEFGHQSMYAQVTFSYLEDPSGTKVLKIRPIPPSELTNTKEVIESLVKAQK